MKRLRNFPAVVVILGCWLLPTCGMCGEEVAVMKVTGDWEIEVTFAGQTEKLSISPSVMEQVDHEKYDSLPLFQPKGASWRKGVPLRGVAAQECCVFGAYEPDSLVLRSGADAQSTAFVVGQDYALDVPSGNIGRLEGGAISAQTPVWASYRYGKMRLDSVVLDTDGKIKVLAGESHVANPPLRKPLPGQKLLGTVWISGRIEKLTPEMLFPISQPREYVPMFLAKEVLPKTYGKLERGEKVRVLAWGDSVTACGYIPDEYRWQQQFVERLRKRFPNAEIILMTEGWGGRNTRAYRNEPPGSPKNYQEKVLDLQPDLIVSEFVNDAWLNEAAVAKDYGEILKDFQERGIEWIICTPHYVRPDWMGLTRQTGIDDDPRPYVKGLREFAKTHRIALADAAFYYGQQYRLGIPYITLMKNNINHPDEYGMSLFADALMKLFP
ncbi:MAG: hypothetical protein Q4D62_07265 [Planctomycetia bacterium]|nr:hypothetical protein [Planctomycetia bacterium]